MKSNLTLNIVVAVLGISIQALEAQAMLPSAPTLKQNTRSTMILQQQGVLDSRSPVLESDGSWYQVYSFEGTAGQTVQITLESDDFDAYLMLLDNNNQQIAQNDDNGNTTNAQITLTLPTSGTYQVIANSYSPGEQGAFRLTVQAIAASNSTAQNHPTCPEYSFEGHYARVTTQGDALRVRSSPNGTVVGSIPNGWEVLVQQTDATGEWTRVTSHYNIDEIEFASAPNFRGGWVASSHLRDLGYLCDKPSDPYSMLLPHVFGQRQVTVGEDWLARGDRLSQVVRSHHQ